MNEDSRWSLGSHVRHGGRAVITLWLVSAVAFAACLQFGLTQFAGYDASYVINLAHRLLIGQFAGLDFFSPTPPFYSLIALLSIRTVGLNWLAFVIAGAVVYTGCGAAIYLLLRRQLGEAVAGLLAVLSVCQAGLLIAFWWHGAATTLFGMMFVATLLRPLRSRREAALLVVMTAIMMGLKPNLALPLLLGGYAWLAGPVRWGLAGRPVFAASCVATAAVLFAAYSWTAHTDPWIYFQSLAAISSRAQRFPIFSELTPDFVKWVSAVGAILLLCPFLFAWVNREGRFTWHASTCLGAVCIGAGALGALTNGDFPISSYPLIAMGLLLATEARSFSRQSTVLLWLCWTLMTGHAVWLGFNRDRIWAAGPESFWQQPAELSRFEDGFFKYATAGSALHGFILETEDSIRQNHVHNVFFGPRIEFGYAQFGLTPPKDMPLWFDLGASWPPGETDTLVQKWKQSNFELVVLLRNDTIFVPAGIINQIRENYVPTYKANNYFYATTWLRKDLAAGAMTEHAKP